MEGKHFVAAPDDNTYPDFDKLLVDIVHYVYHYQITSELAMRTVRLALTDALGCAMETIANGACSPLIGPIVPGTVVPNGFRLPGTTYQIDPVKGAFDMGVLIRYLDHNDGFTGAEWGHPSDNLGAILAVADWLSRNPGERRPDAAPLTINTVLIAMIKAYEIQGCFQQLNAFNAVGLDHVILVKVASTAVVSWLLGVGEAEALNAVSQAWMDGHPLRAYRHAPNAGPRKGWAGGDACMRAVHLALLSRNGQPGAPTVLSAKRWGFYDSLFRGVEFKIPRKFGSWVMENIFFKIVPAEGHALAAIEAALLLRPELTRRGNSWHEDIEKIRIRTHAGACLIINKSGELHNAADRDHCMQYMIAVVMLKGQLLEYGDYADESPWATDSKVHDIRAKCELVEDAQFTEDYHDSSKRSMASGVTVCLKNGTEVGEVVVEYPLGNPKQAGTAQAVRAKSKKNLNLILEESTSQKVIDSIQKEDDMAVRDFVDMFVKQHSDSSKL